MYAILQRSTMSISSRMGTHVLLEVHNAPFAVLNNSASVLAALYAAADAGGLTVVGQMVHEFPVQGCSAVLMISESHLSIHTWPEHGYASVDLFTCGAVSPLPCSPHEPMFFRRPHDSGLEGWCCTNGQPVLTATTDSLWAAVQAILVSLGAGSAMLTWFERGIPTSRLPSLVGSSPL